MSFLLALAAVGAATLAGREAVRVARLAAVLGAGTALLMACWLACAIAGGVAAWLGSLLAAELGRDSTGLAVALFLLLAAAELAVLRPGRVPAEPTRSFGAIAIVLAVSQSTSPAGLLMLGLAVAGAEPGPVAFGGILGSGAVLTAAWHAGRQWETRLPANALRWGVAGLLLLAALASGLSGRVL